MKKNLRVKAHTHTHAHTNTDTRKPVVKHLPVYHSVLVPVIDFITKVIEGYRDLVRGRNHWVDRNNVLKTY